MKKQFLECGKIVTTQGIRGEVRVQPWCDTPDFLTEFPTLYLEGGALPVQVEKARTHKNMAILKLEGVDTIEAAVALRGKVLYVDRSDVTLGPDEYFVQDLIGCEVLDADTGVSYGKIYDVRPTGANDVYYLRGASGRERLVPAIEPVVVQRDVEGGIIRIRPLEGLFDD